MNAGRERPSLNGLKMIVPLRFFNYESDRGNQEKFDDRTNIDLPRIDTVPNSPKTRNNWGNTPYDEFTTQVNKIYEEIVHMRTNIFKIPSGKAGEEYIKELTFWLRQFNSPKSELNSIAMKAFMSLPTLILQKSSPKSIAKEHSECTSHRLLLWKNRDLDTLMKEIRHIQKNFVSSKKPRRTEDVSRIFAKLIMEGKISTALKFLETKTSKGILSLTDDILEELKEKHPHAATLQQHSLLSGPIGYIPPSIFHSINKDILYKAAFKHQRSCRPIGYGCGIVSQNTLLKQFRENK